MAFILCIETSGNLCSVALAENEKLLACAVIREPNAHASQLFGLIQQVINQVPLSMQALNGVAVSSGPGSYTGLRIGVAAAKGICQSLNIPLFALSTLKIIANPLLTKAKIVVPMIDARRNEVYYGVYDTNGNETAKPRAAILKPDLFDAYLLNNTVLFAGSGAAKWKEQCTSTHAYFLPDIQPVASDMVSLAFHKYQSGQSEDIAYFIPDYLKPVHIITKTDIE